MEYILYNHGGSRNHGCEALARTVLKLFEGEQMALYTESVVEDKEYGLDQLVSLVPATGEYSRFSPGFIKAYAQLKTTGQYTMMDTLPYLGPIRSMPDEAVVVSIGGDIYCYEDYRKYIALHGLIAKNRQSILLGCSINEDLIQDQEFCEDLKKYSCISARESLTYELLKSAGIENVTLHPDSAFLLPSEELPLPDGFTEGNTVGINLSPLIERKENSPGILKEAFLSLMSYVLKETDCSIALIPHVIWEENDDRTILKELYDAINCPERVVLIEDCNCMQLKGYISRCRLFVGARTHATIAAYSTGVPTLALGYSLKSRGIATDLFGTDENYVMPVESVGEKRDLVKAFTWIQDNEEQTKNRLVSIMPDYKRKAATVTNDVKRMLTS